MIWWLSFADPARPSGSQFLGCVLIEALSMIEAVQAAHYRDINPGGQVMGKPLNRASFSVLSFPIAPYLNRLLNREDCLALDERITEDIAC